LRVLILTGPTGTGKTDWAVGWAERFPVEIISMDSALVYRGMDIGTAKPAAEVRARVVHHLIDICEPTESYSAGRFVQDAVSCIKEITARGRTALLVGGTQLYLKALLQGLAQLPAASSAFRAELNQRAAQVGWQALHQELAGLDSNAAARIHPHDPQRIQRALEVIHLTGQRLSDLHRQSVPALAGIETVGWCLMPHDRQLLRTQLAQRFARMLEQGLLAEVQTLFNRGDLTAEHPAMRAVGYRQLWAHLSGTCDLSQATAQAISATQQLAKRQLTWLRSSMALSLKSVDPQSPQAFSATCREVEAALLQHAC
jgi:tRNA dimethylallyltransferase